MSYLMDRRANHAAIDRLLWGISSDLFVFDAAL
jgi:hypothetical protein